MAMFSLLASTRPTAATVLRKSETGGGAGGMVVCRRGREDPEDRQEKAFHCTTSLWNESASPKPFGSEDPLGRVTSTILPSSMRAMLWAW